MADMPLTAFGCNNFVLDDLGDHVSRDIHCTLRHQEGSWLETCGLVSHNTQGKDSTGGNMGENRDQRCGDLNPSDLDRPLNETVDDKIRNNRPDYNNRPSDSISFIPDVVDTSDLLWPPPLWDCPHFCFPSSRNRHRFLTDSGVHLVKSNNQFHYRHTVFFSHFKSKVGNFFFWVFLWSCQTCWVWRSSF